MDFFLRIGIDDFRDINGDFGMEYGDYILKEYSRLYRGKYQTVAEAVPDISG